MARLEISNALWKTLYKSTTESMKDLMSFAFGLPVTNNPAGHVDVENITNYSELSFASAKALTGLGVKVFEYPLFAYCDEAQLEEDTPSFLPGSTQTTILGEEITTNPIPLSQWLANQSYTTEELTNGKVCFGLDWSYVSFAQATQLDALPEFTVIDTPTFLSLRPTVEI